MDDKEEGRTFYSHPESLFTTPSPQFSPPATWPGLLLPAGGEARGSSGKTGYMTRYLAMHSMRAWGRIRVVDLTSMTLSYVGT